MRAADVIIVGGGIVGTATALFLRRRNASVILLEQALTGQKASGVNFGNVRRQGRPLHQLPLSQRAHSHWHTLEQLIGDRCEFREVGHLMVAYSREKADAWAEYARAAADYGVEIEILNGNQLRSRYPYLGQGVEAGFLCAGDGHANPRLLTPTVARAARRAGAEIEEDAKVVAIEGVGMDFEVHVSGGGVYRAPVVVIAAGAWGAQMAHGFGEPVPLAPRGPQMGVTEPLPFRIESAISVLSDEVPESVYFRQVERGNLVFGGGIRGPASTETGLASVLPENTLRQMPYLRRLMPAFGAVSVIRTWSGVEGYLPDMLPVLGPSKKRSGLFYAFGFSGAGFQLGLGVGDVLAELIVTGRSDISLEENSVDRFGNAAEA